GSDAPLQDLPGLLDDFTPLIGRAFVRLPPHDHARPAAQVEPQPQRPLRDREPARQHDRRNEDASTQECPIHRAPPSLSVAALRACRTLTPCSHASRIGLAMKIEENVPTTIPITSTSENPC